MVVLGPTIPGNQFRCLSHSVGVCPVEVRQVRVPSKEHEYGLVTTGHNVLVRSGHGVPFVGTKAVIVVEIGVGTPRPDTTGFVVVTGEPWSPVVVTKDTRILWVTLLIH